MSRIQNFLVKLHFNYISLYLTFSTDQNLRMNDCGSWSERRNERRRNERKSGKEKESVKRNWSNERGYVKLNVRSSAAQNTGIDVTF